MRHVIVLLLFTAAITGCGPSVKFFPMNEPPDDVLADQIEVLPKSPDRPFVAVGLIKVKARSKFASSPEKMMRILKEEARHVGADAIVVEGLTSEAGVYSSANTYTGKTRVHTYRRDVLQATAIAWK